MVVDSLLESLAQIAPEPFLAELLELRLSLLLNFAAFAISLTIAINCSAFLQAVASVKSASLVLEVLSALGVVIRLQLPIIELHRRLALVRLEDDLYWLVRVDQDVFLEVFALADLSLQDEALWEQLVSLKLDEGACLGLACEQIDSQHGVLVVLERCEQVTESLAVLSIDLLVHMDVEGRLDFRCECPANCQCPLEVGEVLVL